MMNHGWGAPSYPRGRTEQERRRGMWVFAVGFALLAMLFAAIIALSVATSWLKVV